MESAMRLNSLIEQVKGRLEADNVNILDHDACIECLSQCVSAELCIDIYENYINY